MVINGPKVKLWEFGLRRLFVDGMGEDVWLATAPKWAAHHHHYENLTPDDHGVSPASPFSPALQARTAQEEMLRSRLGHLGT